MKKLIVLLVSILVWMVVGCATTPKTSPGVTFKGTVQFEQLPEAAQKEAVGLGYGPGDTVKLDIDGRGNAKIVPKK